MQRAVVELHDRRGRAAAVGVHGEESRFRMGGEVERHVRIIECIINGLTAAECERIGKRIWYVDAAGGEIQELLARLRTLLGENHLARLKIRLQSGDERQLALWSPDGTYGD